MGRIADSTVLSHIPDDRAHPDAAAAPVCESGTVYVRRVGLRLQGMCTCGAWRGRLRLLRALAVNDAHEHGARNGCVPAFPLVPPHGANWIRA